MNKNLYKTDKGIVEFNEEMRNHMKICFSQVKDVNTNDPGYIRNQELQNKQTIEYSQLKRIKNFFDNFKGNQNDISFILNGGVKMKNWVENELRRMRENDKVVKKNRMDAGMMNQFIDTHTKDGIDVRPSQEHTKTVDRYNYKLNESIKRINQLITKL